MNCKVEKSRLSGTITCPSNKSYTHRAIFLASLAGKNSQVNNILYSADTKATIDACRCFGTDLTQNGSTIIINEKLGTKSFTAEINAENSGTTIRIAAAIASLFPHETLLTGDSSLKKRPMQPLLDALESVNAVCSSTDGKPPIRVKGKIRGGEISIPGNVSSQFISALLIIAPLTENGLDLSIEGNLVSKPYLDATIAAMRRFGVTIQTLIPYKRYNITPQIYKPAVFDVPIDFSSLALLLASSVLVGDKLSIKGNIGNLPQGDEAFIDILEELGVKVKIEEDTITTTTPEKLNGGRFDLSNSPDLLPPLAILALKTSKPIEIVNVKHARYKETDRIAILARELAKIGIMVQENDDGLVLGAPTKVSGAVLDSENDHRLFMAFCIAAMFVGGCTVTDSESVAVSYPDFIKDMNNVGAVIKS